MIFLHNCWNTLVFLPLFTTCAVLVKDAQKNVLSRKEKYVPDYKYYHNLSRIYSHISEIVDRNPHYMQLDHSFKSREGLSQIVLRVANFSDSRNPLESSHPYWNTAKVKVLFSYGEHAREFLPVESLFHLLNNITQGLSAPKDSPEENFSRLILTRIDLFIIAMLNPDGRKHIEKTHNYCWRGTSTGVDLNRNFDWNYGGEGSSSVTGTEELRGLQAFSEPECQVLTALTKKYKFDGFISFHSGIKEIYLPFADSKSKVIHRKPLNFQAMLQLAKQMSESSNPHYVYGQAFDILRYPADGTIFDFMAGVRKLFLNVSSETFHKEIPHRHYFKIPFSYAVELWGEGDIPGVQCFDLFNPQSEQLQNSVKLLHSLYEKFFLYLIEWKERQIFSAFSIETEGPSLILCFIMLGIVVFITLIAMCTKRMPECMRLYPRRRIISLKSLSSTLHVS